MYYTSRNGLPKDGYYLKVVYIKDGISESFMVGAPLKDGRSLMRNMISELKTIKEYMDKNTDEDKLLNILCQSKYFCDKWEFDSENKPCKLFGYGVYYYKDGIKYSFKGGSK